MSQPRTKEFYACLWHPKEKYYETVKHRGYIRSFSTTETGHQIDVGIHHAGNGWEIVELSSGIRITWRRTLTEVFQYLQDDKIIERVWKSVNEDAKPGTTVYQAKATIAAIKD